MTSPTTYSLMMLTIDGVTSFSQFNLLMDFQNVRKNARSVQTRDARNSNALRTRELSILTTDLQRESIS